MAISAVGSLANVAGAGLSTLSVTPATSGDAFVLVVKISTASLTVSSVSGGGVTTWTNLTAYQDGTHETELWLGKITSTGSSTITVTYSGSIGTSDVDLAAQEFTAGLGTSTKWTKDTASGQSNASSTTVAFPSLTTVGSNELYFGYTRSGGSLSAGSTSGFTYVATADGNLLTYNPSVSGVSAPTASVSPASTSAAVGALILVGATRTISTAGGNWSATTAWTEGVVPTSADDVVATATSGNLTIDTTAACRSFDMTSYVGTLTHNAFVLSVGDASGGAFKLVTGMTYSPSLLREVDFVSTSNNGGTGWSVDFAGKSMGVTTYNGVGGKWVQQSNYTQQFTLTLTAGTLDFNGKTITGASSNASFDVSGSGVRTLTMGASSFTGAWGGWTAGNSPTNLTISSNTATMSSTATGMGITLGGVNWNGFSITVTGIIGTITPGGGTLANLTVNTNNAGDSFTISNGNLTVTNALSLSGGSAGPNRNLITSETLGTQRTLTVNGSVTATNCDFRDIVGAGSASWNLASATGGSGDALGNSGITFTTATTRYAVAAGSLWSSTSMWSTSSGGSSGASMPLPQDTARFDASSPAGTYEGFGPGRLCKDLDCTGFTRTLADLGGGSIYGSITLASGMTLSGSNLAITMAARSSATITCAGKTFLSDLNFNGPGGTWTLQDAFATSASGGITINRGTLDLNAQTVTTTKFLDGSGTRTVVLTNATINLTSTANTNVFDVSSPTTFTGGSSCTVAITTASSNARTIQVPTGATLGTVTYTLGSSTGGLVLTAAFNTGALTIGTLNVSGSARTLQFSSGVTTTISTLWNVFGTAGNLITIQSSGAANHTLSKASGTVSSDYLSISKSTATGGAAWYAGANSTDGGSNTGWVFTAVPVTISPTGIASSEAMGTPTVAAGTVTVAMTGIASAEAFGTPTITGGTVNLTPTGIASAEAFGTPSVGGQTVSVTGIASSGAVGTPTVSPGTVTVLPTGIASAGAVGTPTVTNTGVHIHPVGIASAEAFGTPIVIIYQVPSTMDTTRYPDNATGAGTTATIGSTTAPTQSAQLAYWLSQVRTPNGELLAPILSRPVPNILGPEN